MFETLSDRLGGVFDKLRGRGALTEDGVRRLHDEIAASGRLEAALTGTPPRRRGVETSLREGRIVPKPLPSTRGPGTCCVPSFSLASSPSWASSR